MNILRGIAICTLILVLNQFYCVKKENRYKSALGFSFLIPDEIEISDTVNVRTAPKTGNISIRHKINPECLNGSIEPFLPISPEEFFENLSNERNLSGTHTYLQKKAEITEKNGLFSAEVSYYNEDSHDYKPAVIGAFELKDELWIVMLRWDCDEQIFSQQTKLIISSLHF